MGVGTQRGWMRNSHSWGPRHAFALSDRGRSCSSPRSGRTRLCLTTTAATRHMSTTRRQSHSSSMWPSTSGPTPCPLCHALSLTLTVPFPILRPAPPHRTAAHRIPPTSPHPTLPHLKSAATAFSPSNGSRLYSFSRRRPLLSSLHLVPSLCSRYARLVSVPSPP